MTSMRRNDVASTSFRRHVPNRFLINQCQIITFLILNYDIIENSRIELRGIVLPVQVGGLLGGPKGMLAPLSNYWGGLAPPPPPLAPPPLFLRLCHQCRIAQYEIFCAKVCAIWQRWYKYKLLGLVVQSIVSLTNSLRGQLVKCFTTL